MQSHCRCSREIRPGDSTPGRERQAVGVNGRRLPTSRGIRRGLSPGRRAATCPFFVRLRRSSRHLPSSIGGLPDASRTFPALPAANRAPAPRRRWTGSRRLCQSRSMSKTQFDVRAILAGERAAGHPRHRQGLGPHPARLQGGPLVRPRLRRLVLPPAAGRRAEHAAELRDEVLQAHRRLRGRGDRQHRAVAGQGPAVRDAGDARSRSSAGSTTRTPIRSSPSRTRWSSCARSRTCGRAPT